MSDKKTALSVATGTATGALGSAATYSAVGAWGTASTGTAIASLAGAAKTSAILATCGGPLGLAAGGLVLAGVTTFGIFKLLNK